ncbi:DNA-(apurinic or apyrimidinic site) lyase [Hypsibius exemplaris]|uniref:DNA-(Apurinic or apyrimidinic site) lyase n=1 Tax=Hypsibius exemplaris TaxID=2072580 RepID=A0A1W0WKJ8_HYPEX|nr:DNA-(apurinic or apyrimidinic site) lyase [Hypsibius exemplaris]
MKRTRNKSSKPSSHDENPSSATPPSTAPPAKKKKSDHQDGVEKSLKLEASGSVLPLATVPASRPLSDLSCAGCPTDQAISLRSLKFVGAHCSIKKGPQTAVEESMAMGANAFALFVRSARTWTCPAMSDEAVLNFKKKLNESGISPSKIVCHGSYLINPGAPADDILTKSRLGMLDEMQRCERLGIVYYNIHPGSTCGKITINECIGRIAESVNQSLEATKDVVLLLENMSCQGNTIGGKLGELAGILAKVDKKFRDRVGVCLDTCHAFAAGNDISSAEGWNTFMGEVERVIGLDRLKAFHLNDSTFPVGEKKDRHALIGKGCIGLEGFRILMNDPRTNNLPMILETDEDAFAHEVPLLFSLCKS